MYLGGGAPNWAIDEYLDLQVKGKPVSRFRGAIPSAPVSDLRGGDTFWNTETSIYYVYADASWKAV